MDQSGNDYVKQYGLMHLAKLPNNAILIVKGDVITNSIRYLQRSLPSPLISLSLSLSLSVCVCVYT
jgi:hypothetical protein